ncbi:MAG: hypothetical protein IIA12_05120 [Proteobacteria bacterium]|nr:hypothetical protein [Pseudomonadota bacterium]
MNRSNIPMLCVVAFLVAFPTSAALAGKFNAVVNGKSYHFNSTYDWNENNFGLGIEHEFDSKSAWRVMVMANAFRDSTDNMSYMAGAGLHRRLYETERLSGFYVQVGLNAFIMTRDDVDNSKPFPGILPSMSLGNEKIGFNLTYLPRQAIEMTTNSNVVDPTVSGILFIQFKVSLDLFMPP